MGDTYQLTEEWQAVGEFLPGRTITIALYDLETGSAIALDSNSCTEIGSTGYYVWSSDDITTPLAAFTKVLWVMSDAGNGDRDADHLRVGGYVENVHSADDAADAVHDEALLAHSASGSAGEAQQLAAYAGWIHYNLGGASGTDYPQGTPTSPIDNLADVNTVSFNTNIDRMLASGPVTGDGDIAGLYVEAQRPFEAFALISGFTSGIGQPGMVKYFRMIGDAQSEYFQATECILHDLSNLSITAWRCGLRGNLACVTDADFVDCYQDDGDGPTVVSGDGSMPITFRRWTGDLTLATITGTDVVNIDMVGGHITIAASCTGGTIVLRGIGTFTDSSAGAAVDTTGLIDPTDVASILEDTGTTLPATLAALPAQNADAVWDEPRAGHATAGTFGENTGDAPMRGTDGANTVVPLAAATDQAEHDATQAALAAVAAAITGLNNLSSAQVTAAVWGITEAALASAGPAGFLVAVALSPNTDIDYAGNDALGWQLILKDTAGSEIARANLYDEAKARIPAATTVSQFIAALKAITRVEPV